MPGAPQKDAGAMYPLPALVAAKLQAQLDGTAKSLDNEFILALPETNNKFAQGSKDQTITFPKLALPGGKFLEPEKDPDALMKIVPLPEEDEMLYAEWYEQQVKEFKEDMRMDERYR